VKSEVATKFPSSNFSKTSLLSSNLKFSGFAARAHKSNAIVVHACDALLLAFEITVQRAKKKKKKTFSKIPKSQSQRWPAISAYRGGSRETGTDASSRHH
jgi:lipoate-protein ligase A